MIFARIALYVPCRVLPTSSKSRDEERSDCLRIDRDGANAGRARAKCDALTVDLVVEVCPTRGSRQAGFRQGLGAYRFLTRTATSAATFTKTEGC